MNSSDYSRERATSPWMLGASVLIHGLLILALVVVSTAVVKPKPPERPIVTVTPVAPPGPPAPVILEPKATKEPEAVSLERLERVDPPERAEPAKRTTVTTKKVASKPADTIPITKNKRKPKTVAEVPKKEPKKQPPKKQEDPEDHLKKRLKALQEKVNTQKHQTASETQPPNSKDTKRNGAFGREAASGLTDEQLARWYNGMREKINAHWSVFQENRAMDRKTVVGVQIADDGTLLNARVDESSGDPVFDTSAMRAVHQAAPFPPVPPRIREKIRQEGGLALSFRPGGIQ